jgi:hypothetical protein
MGEWAWGRDSLGSDWTVQSRLGGMLICCIGASGAGLRGDPRCRNDLVFCLYRGAGARADSGQTLILRESLTGQLGTHEVSKRAFGLSV